MVFLACILSCQKGKEKAVKNLATLDNSNLSGKPETLYCDITNYEEYIYSTKKTDQLIMATGQGCQLSNQNFKGQILNKADFRQADVSDTIFNDAKLQGADFRGAIVDETKFIKAELQTAKFQNTEYQVGFYNKAELQGATYSEYDRVEAYMRKISGQGIRDPESRGMVKVEPEITEDQKS